MSRITSLSIYRSYLTPRTTPHILPKVTLIKHSQQQRLYAGAGETDSKATARTDKSNTKPQQKGSNNAQPKILNESIPTEESEDVKQHNADLAKRHDHAETHAADDNIKVDKQYWSESK